MAIKLTISDAVKFRVHGSLTDETGARQPFDFYLIARRMDAEQLRHRLDPDLKPLIADVMRDVTTGWGGVRDAGGQEVEFSQAALEQLLLIPNLGALVLDAYVAACGARAGN